MQKKLIRIGIVARGDDTPSAVRAVCSPSTAAPYADYRFKVRAEAEISIALSSEKWTRLCVHTMGLSLPSESPSLKRTDHLKRVASTEMIILQSFLRDISFKQVDIDKVEQMWIDPQQEGSCEF